MMKTSPSFSGTWARDYERVLDLVRRVSPAPRCAFSVAYRTMRTIHMSQAKRLVPDGASLLKAAGRHGANETTDLERELFDRFFLTERKAGCGCSFRVQLVRRMNEEGVGLLAGTDVATEWTVPGAALHEELYALVEAGLTPLESLRTATLNPARYFGKAGEFGAAAPGMAADLVLIDGDPLADVRNARRISGVGRVTVSERRSTIPVRLQTCLRTPNCSTSPSASPPAPASSSWPASTTSGST
jgi:hypothetical protein